jgi:hypothetical protein
MPNILATLARTAAPAAVAVTLVLVAAPATAQKYPPTIDFESALDTYFDDSSGLISFNSSRVIFAPDGQFNGLVAVLDSDGQIVAKFDYYPDYGPKVGVYASVQAKGPADVTLTEPGLYTIVWVVDGQPATRLPVRLEKVSDGDDPFAPGATYRFDGYWRTTAYLAMDTYSGESWPVLYYWLGGKDLAPGERTGRPFVKLYRDGDAVAHSRRTEGHFRQGHFDQTKATLFHPHRAGTEANVRPYLLDDWLVDGDYELRVTRQSDGATIRSFDFRVAGGEFEPHPRTVLGYEPRTDYIAPRVQRKGATALELTEAIWIQDRKLD